MAADTTPSPSSSPLPEPEKWERGGAAAIHLISIPAPLWGPLLAGLIMKGRSRYVEVHSWKALKEYLILSAIFLAWGAISLTITVTRLYGYWQADWEGFSIWPFLLRMAIGWVVFFLIGAVVTVLSILQAWKAWQGQWPKGEVKKALKAG